MTLEILKKNLFRFPAENLVQRSVEDLLEKMDSQGFGGVVFGASGGIDSLVCAALCLKGREKEDEWRVIGLKMIDSRVKGESYNPEMYGALGADLIDMDITAEAVEAEKRLGMPPRWLAVGLMKLVLKWVPTRARRRVILRIKKGSRSKWAFLHYQLLTNLHRLRITKLNEYAVRHGLMRIVCANRTENLLGFFVEEGIDDPNMGDYAPILDLYKSQVIRVAHWLQLPPRVIRQRPSPGFGGIYDEEIIGPYELVDLVLVGLELGYSDAEIAEALEPLALKLSQGRTPRGGPFDIQYTRFLRKMTELRARRKTIPTNDHVTQS
jgi:NAD+ synthase